MKIKIKKAFALLGLLVLCNFLGAQDSFYDINKIQKIEIQFSQSNWDYILDTNKLGADLYILAQYVKVNGIQMDSVGVKYKGSSSYDSTFKKKIRCILSLINSGTTITSGLRISNWQMVIAIQA